MRTKSKKAKGRRLQNWVRDELLKMFPKLTDNDVVCAIMGERGVDVKLSTKAKKFIPFSIECKTHETFKKMWEALKQNNYHTASEEMLDSKWAKQTPKRAEELSSVMKSCKI